MFNHRIALWLGSIGWTLLLLPRQANAQVNYERDVKPLFAEKCIACHGAIRQESGLRLDHGQLLRKGSESKSIVDLSRPEQSELINRVVTNDLSLRMPPEHEGTPLTEQQAQTLLNWIAAGATSPDNEKIPVGPKEHWAWQPLIRPALPVVANSANPIDAFIDSKLIEAGIEPLPQADHRTLLQRVTIDLIGLPPTPNEQAAFLEDPSAESWTQVVDRLLNDAAHGERWARHWMDVWRYSDWDGYKDELRSSQRHIWRWRDWIIDSLNSDKGYDAMILEMLAGDELFPTDDRALSATGFLARNYHNRNRDIFLDAAVEHTAKAFLSLTINCARCHDHKYDPFTQREYYSFRAIFEPYNVRTERVPGQANLKLDGLARVYDSQLDEPTYLYVAGNEKQPDKSQIIPPAVPAVFDSPLQVMPVELPSVSAFPALREYVYKEDIADAERRLEQARNTLAKTAIEQPASAYEIATQAVIAAEVALLALRARWQADCAKFGVELPPSTSPESVEQLRVAAGFAELRSNMELAKLNHAKAARDLAVAKSSEKTAKQKQVDDALAALAQAQKKLEDSTPDALKYTSVGDSYPKQSSGRRLALARWIVGPQSPLAARVAVNYVWLHHFGEPLVENVFDFGLRSPEPIHRELLDWLAVEFIEHRWSFKHLHRLIATSQVYRRASSAESPVSLQRNSQRDSDNHLLWRANVRRLEAETIRDSMFHTAGNLDRTVHGPDIDFNLGEKVNRRSVYFRHAYEKQMSMLVLFDAAAPTECYRRNPSIIPQQALALANSPLSFDQARLLAAKLSEAVNSQAGDILLSNQAFIEAAFVTVLSRTSKQEEMLECSQFLLEQSQRLAADDSLSMLPGLSQATVAASTDPRQRARENLIHVLMNHNDFVTIR